MEPMNLSLIINKLQLIQDLYEFEGDEKVEFSNKTTIKIGKKSINLATFSKEEYLKGLREAREITIERLDRIDKMLNKLNNNK